MKIFLMIVTGLLAGCASPSTKLVVDSSTAKSFSISKITDTEKTSMQLNEANQRLIESKLEEVLNFCLPRLSGFEVKSADQAKKAYWLSMSGLVAGAVAVPALTAANATSNASWIAGLGGWSGATNFASESLKESGLSGSTIANTRNNIIHNVKNQIEIASDGTKAFDERRNALMKARAECVMYEISVPNISGQK